MKVFHIRQSQLPVGQGGFHAGEIYECWPEASDSGHLPELRLAWAYDCGSNQTDALDREISAVAVPKLDFLFLSHLDNDHVSGVDKLLLRTPTKAVVLPYLNDEDWVLHLAAASSTGSISGTFVTLVENPLEWFQARGVERVYYVSTQSDDEDGGEGEGGPPESDPKKTKPRDDGMGKPVWSGQTKTIGNGYGDQIQGTKPIEMIKLEATATLGILGLGKALDWVLAPFAVRPSDAKMQTFIQELENLFGKGLTQGQYAAHARTATGRLQLRKAYDAVWADHNLHSMALYSGPTVAMLLNDTVSYGSHGRFEHHSEFPAWLSTGDFEASGKRRRTKLIRYYAKYAASVGQITLPHHGSDLSFHTDLLDAYSNLQFAIAAVGPNGYGQPGLTVQAEIARRPSVDFIRVDQNPNTRFNVSLWFES